jgi:hypothetical protein
MCGLRIDRILSVPEARDRLTGARTIEDLAALLAREPTIALGACRMRNHSMSAARNFTGLQSGAKAGEPGEVA